MKMKYAIAAAAAAACLASAGANAAMKSPAYDTAANSGSGMYVGLNTGMSFYHESDGNTLLPNELVKSPGFNVGGYVGYKFTKNWRTDLSVDYTRNGAKDFTLINLVTPSKSGPVLNPSLHQIHVLVNGYFDYPLEQYHLTPYVGLGLGYDHVGIHSSNSASKDVLKGVGFDSLSGLGWQLTTGVKYSINQNFDLGLSYRLVGTNGTDKVAKDLGAGDLAKINTILNSIIGINATYNF